jgi:hypothetical protein
MEGEAMKITIVGASLIVAAIALLVFFFRSFSSKPADSHGGSDGSAS